MRFDSRLVRSTFLAVLLLVVQLGVVVHTSAHLFDQGHADACLLCQSGGAFKHAVCPDGPVVAASATYVIAAPQALPHQGKAFTPLFLARAPPLV